MRVLLIVAITIGSIQSGVAAEVFTDAKVLEVNRTSLSEFRAGPAASFIVNVPERVTRSLVEQPESRTLQSFPLAGIDERPVQFRVSSRLGFLDIGIDFELTTKVTVKREIRMTVLSQTQIRYRESDSDPPLPAFTSERVSQEITTAEGASILVGGFLTEREAKQLASMDALKDSPILKSLFSETPLDLVLVLTPRDVRAPAMTAVAAPGVVATPRPAAPRPAGPRPQGRYTVQVATFRNLESASALLARLEKRHQDVFIHESSTGKPMYRVRVGRLEDVQAVKQLEKLLRNEGFDPLVVSQSRGLTP
jgi:cell division septation protein DedD